MIGELNNLLDHRSFLFGITILVIYQFAYFQQLNTTDAAFGEKISTIPNLRTSDFVGANVYHTSLILFIISSLLIYTACCLICPTVLKGWGAMTGVATDKLDGYANSVGYPLYVAAGFMGIAQPGIPILSDIAKIQRSFFQWCIGVPKHVTESASYFSNQILAKSSSDNELRRDVETLISDAWIGQFDRFGDAVFYRQQIGRLGLDGPDGARVAGEGSRREYSKLIQALVFAASLGTARKSGVGALSDLASLLSLEMPQRRSSGSNVTGSIVALLALLAFMWIVFPMIYVALRYAAGSALFVWSNEMRAAQSFLVAQALPVFLVSLFTFAIVGGKYNFQMATKLRKSGGSLWRTILNKHPILLFFIFVFAVLFDFAQALFTYGTMPNETRSDVILASLPTYFMHATILVIVCVCSIYSLVRANLHEPLLTRSAMLNLISVGATALLYASARMIYFFSSSDPYQIFIFIFIVTFLNVAAAGLSFLSLRLVFVAEDPPLEGRVPATP